MKGKAYEYAKKIHVVKNYQINTDKGEFTIITDNDRWTRKFESATEFFKYWYEEKENMQVEAVQKSIQVPSTRAEVLPEKDNALADQMVELLMDNINKVKNNPSYLNQAKVVNSNVNSIIQVQKLKLEYIKQLKKNGNS